VGGLECGIPLILLPCCSSFFITRLMAQRKASPHTIASYRDTFRLLLQFAQKAPTQSPLSVGLDDLDASFGRRVPGRRRIDTHTGLGARPVPARYGELPAAAQPP